MRAVPVIVRYALEESLRRRVFLIVLILTAAFLGLFALGAREAFQEVERFGAEGPLFDAVDEQTLTGATLLGLAMFGTLFLGAVLAVFLTLAVVRGDAERGLLQPLVVRPVGRVTLLGSRFLAAAAVCSVYVAGVFAAAAGITYWAGGWWPDRFAQPTAELAAAAVVIAALSLLGSVFLSATANGIAIFMLFGAGLVSGLLGQIGEALASERLIDVSRAASWALPFEALYQDGLSAISSESFGLTSEALQLGPFGGAQAGGPALVPWTLTYLAVVGLLGALAFSRRDL
ncbi:MAG: ABC transporter permease subunit [Actinobacteria bacterium]|nr:ABC transporter permease subunit [Actinomycetota bacterium]